MSLRLTNIQPIPEETKRVAQSAFPKGNVYMQLRDELGDIYDNAVFADLYSTTGQPGISPWRLALITLFQFAENLTDRQAAEAVRGRLDWKYAQSLELRDAGFDFSVLSEFRLRLVSYEASERLFNELLSLCVTRGWLKAGGTQRTDSTRVVSAVRALNQLEIVGETLRHTLNVLATVAPEWLRERVPVAWYERYAEHFDDFHLPSKTHERQALSETIGRDGYWLLEAIYASSTLAWLREVPAVQTLRQMWVQQYWIDGEAVKRREPPNMPPAGTWLRSPYDPEARYGKKRAINWIGYKVHFTETCEADSPHLIVQVQTVPAIEQDHHALVPIQADLATRELLPQQQLVDAGYVSAKRILHSAEVYGIDLIGPVHNDPSWQARLPDALDATLFTIHWDKEFATCPQGQTSMLWQVATDAQGESIVRIVFAAEVCHPCPLRQRCTNAQRHGRSMSLRYPQARHEILQQARLRQQTPTFKLTYAKRAGIEGTFSEANAKTGLQQSRYIGFAKTYLQNLICATATNLVRIVRWFNSEPFAQTRRSRFAALTPPL